MDGKEIVERLHGLLFSTLTMQSPVLSGNMKSLIKESVLDADTREIVIDAPFYDMKKWEKDKVIVHTGETIDGRTAYAEWVNRLGAFGSHNKSEHWVNWAILSVVQAIANETEAYVIYEI